MEHRRELRWVHTTHQARSRRTLERIRDAAERLLIERDFESISVSEITQRADSSVGAFYARFRDKEALLHLIHEHFCEEAEATVDEALDPERWEDATASEILSALTAFMVHIYRERSGLLRAFVRYGCTHPDFRQRDERLGEYVFARLRALLLSRDDGFGHPDPVFAVAFGLQLISGLLQGVFVLGQESHGLAHLPPGRLEAELSRAYHGYLGLPFPGGGDGSGGAAGGSGGHEPR